MIDLAFIDGMHLSEYALRDVMNTERYTHAASVIVLDDMLPRNDNEAARDREGAGLEGRAWAGDVYKVISTFRELRPDAVFLEVDTRPTGAVVLLLPDSSSTVLDAAYDDMVEGSSRPTPRTSPRRSSVAVGRSRPSGCSRCRSGRRSVTSGTPGRPRSPGGPAGTREPRPDAVLAARGTSARPPAPGGDRVSPGSPSAQGHAGSRGSGQRGRRAAAEALVHDRCRRPDDARAVARRGTAGRGGGILVQGAGPGSSAIGRFLVVSSRASSRWNGPSGDS